MTSTSKAKKGGSLVWSLVVAGLAIFVMAAIAGPKMMVFQNRSKQSEAKSNLKSLFTAQKSHHNEKGAFEPNLAVAGFRPERGNRYAYFLSEAGPALRPEGEPAQGGYTIVANDVAKYGGEPILTVAQTGCPVTPGKDEAGREIKVGATPTGFVALAARKESSRYDCWSIASMERKSATGQTIPPGEPFEETAK